MAGSICRKGKRRHIHDICVDMIGGKICGKPVVIITRHGNQVHDDGSVCEKVVTHKPTEMAPWRQWDTGKKF